MPAKSEKRDSRFRGNDVSQIVIVGLQHHPDTPPTKVSAVQVELLATIDDILLTYVVTGVDGLIISELSASSRAGELWRTTCFELFVRPEGSESYFEFNFSPSTQWAAYRFSARREGMGLLELSVPPFVHDSRTAKIETLDDRKRTGSEYLLEVDLDLSDLPLTQWRIGLSAIIEETGGHKSYWALAHPPGPPDFHHPDCFVLNLPPPTGA